MFLYVIISFFLEKKSFRQPSLTFCFSDVCGEDWYCTVSHLFPFEERRLCSTNTPNNRGTQRLSCHDVGKIFYLSAHTALALKPPRLPHLSSALSLLHSLSISCVTASPTSPSLFPLRHPVFISSPSSTSLLSLSVQTSASLCRWGCFEPASHVGERPLKAKGSSCHRWITLLCFYLAAAESHRVRHLCMSRSRGCQMSVLYSQTAMNNETEVRHKRQTQRGDIQHTLSNRF